MNKPTLIALPSLAFLLPVAILLFTVPVVAQDEPTAEIQPVPAPGQAQETAPETATDEPSNQQAAEPIPPATGTAAQPLKEFKPSETILAESAVSFPVDI